MEFFIILSYEYYNIIPYLTLLIFLIFDVNNINIKNYTIFTDFLSCKSFVSDIHMDVNIVSDKAITANTKRHQKKSSAFMSHLFLTAQ